MCSTPISCLLPSGGTASVGLPIDVAARRCRGQADWPAPARRGEVLAHPRVTKEHPGGQLVGGHLRTLAEHLGGKHIVDRATAQRVARVAVEALRDG